MSWRFRVGFLFITGLLILITGSPSFASGRKVWSIDLQTRGYDLSSNVRIWFWRHYLVVDPDVKVCRALNNRNLARISPSRPSRDSSFFERPYKTLVFDLDSRQEVSLEALVGADRTAACPQLQGWWGLNAPHDIAAAWKDRLVRADGHGGLYLNREGQPETPLCRACAQPETPLCLTCADDLVLWVAPDLLLIQKYIVEKVDDKVLSATVVDLDGRTRYRLPLTRLLRNAVFNSTGTRFALFSHYQTRWGHIRYWLDEIGSPTVTSDRKTLRVFSTDDGQQLFEKTWHKDEADADNKSQPDLKLALSDDGAFLAYYNHEATILIYRLVADGKH